MNALTHTQIPQIANKRPRRQLPSLWREIQEDQGVGGWGVGRVVSGSPECDPAEDSIAFSLPEKHAQGDS